MKAGLLIIVFFTLFLSCQKAERKDLTSTPAVLKIDTSTIAVFNYDTANKLIKQTFSTGINASLKNRDLTKIETALKHIIAERNWVQIKLFEKFSGEYPEENYTLPGFIINEKNYVRRYLVIKNARGEKEIFVSLICDDIAPYLDWRKDLREGHGGGTCLFSFKLNFTTNKYYDVYFHAEA